MSKFERLSRFIRSSLDRLTTSEASTESSPIIRAKYAILEVVEKSLTPEGAPSKKNFEIGSVFDLSMLDDGTVFRVHFTVEQSGGGKNESLEKWQYATVVYDTKISKHKIYLPVGSRISDGERLMLDCAYDINTLKNVQAEIVHKTIVVPTTYIHPQLDWNDPFMTFRQDFFARMQPNVQIDEVTLHGIEVVSSGSSIRVLKREQEPFIQIDPSFQPARS